MSGAGARAVAYDVLAAVTESDAYANLLLPTRIARAKLSPEDAGFATELTYGTLRMLGFYDAVLAIAARRSVDKIDPKTLDVLRLGTHQLLGMRTPAHAAVDESVRLQRRVGHVSAAGFVNGVLRTVARTELAEWQEQVTAELTDADERLAVLFAHPAWIVRAFRRSLAAEGAEDELEDLLARDNVAPRVTLAALPGRALASDLDALAPEGPSPLGWSAPAGDPARLPAVAASRLRVQDGGSQLAALALSRAEPIRDGERWLDLCAGPGGKSALLAAELAATGGHLTANEVVPARAELVARAVEAFGDAVTVRVGDGRDVGTTEAGRYDRILVDAPCTGLGALRRRPEARWRKSPADVAQLRPLQESLLDAALGAVAVGGLVAYVTCSPHRAETVAVVRDALEKHPNVEAVDTPAVLAGITREAAGIAETTHAQLWPHRAGTDAMFIQLLRRTSE